MTTQLPTRRGVSKYSESQRELALITLARWSGNSRKAAAELEKNGVKIPYPTLKTWPKTYRDDYLRIQMEVLPEIREQAREEHMEMAATAMDVERQMIERLKGQVDDIDSRDMPGALRNVATTAGIHEDKAEQLSTDSPVKKTRDFAGIVREFKQATGIDVEFSIPDEIPDATVVEEHPELPKTAEDAPSQPAPLSLVSGTKTEP